MNLLGVRIDPLTVAALNEEVERLLENRSQSVVAYMHVHGVNLAYRNPKLTEFFNSAATVYCDGEGVRLGAKLLGSRIPERIALTDWVWDLLRICDRHGASVYFLGSTEEVVRAAVARAQERFPTLKLLGYHNGYFEKRGSASEGVVKEINRLHPDVLLVGFGMPIQEEWLIDNHKQLNAKLVLPVGSCFDYVSGKKRRCPRWMASHGLEWLYRLLQEPRRLFKRYVIGNPLFMARILWAALSQRNLHGGGER